MSLRKVPRSSNSMIYTPHPASNQLQYVKPAKLVDALQKAHTVRYEALLEMRSVVQELSKYMLEFDPHFIPVFATGGIAVMFPVVDEPVRAGHLQLVDNQVMHMFPGLAWEEKNNGAIGTDLFVEEAVPILQRLANQGGTLKILVADVTYSGSGINTMVGALRAASIAAGLWDVDIRIIALVDGKNAKPAGTVKSNAEVWVNDGYSIAMDTPGGYQYDGQLRDRQFTTLRKKKCKASFSVQVSYWCIKDIFTEDVADLVGAIRVKDTLDIKASDAAGIITFTFGNGHSRVLGSSSTAGMTIYNFLSGLNVIALDSFRETSQLPPLKK